jgi:hypothetical protein
MFLFLLNFAFTFTLTHTPSNLGFKNPKLRIDINQASCPAQVNLRAIVEDAVKTWNQVSLSSIELSVGNTTTATTATMPPTAYCDATMVGNTLGQGGSGLDPSSNRLVNGFLRLNTNPGQPGYILNQTTERIVIVAAHEIGHVLGLGHSDDSYALMYYSINTKEELNLSQDDVDGIVYLYPRDELGEDDMLGGCAMTNTQVPPNGHMYLFLLLPFLFWTMQRQRFYSRTQNRI